MRSISYIQSVCIFIDMIYVFLCIYIHNGTRKTKLSVNPLTAALRTTNKATLCLQIKSRIG